jgi:hyperosmotically inducible protein
MLPYYTLFDFMAYTVEGSKVTLLGKVTNPTLKSDAEHVVKKIEGVEAVDNKIEVLPPSPNDERIRLAQYRAIYGTPGLSRYAMGTLPSIHIIVDRGNVTLVGTVNSEADKTLAGVQANGVPGVFSVTNNLAVASSR